MLSGESIRAYPENGRVLIRAADFIYLLPHPSLREYISNYTFTFPKAGMMTDSYTIIPHASSTLVFSLESGGYSSRLFGSLNRPVQVGREANSSSLLFIVEFQPRGYYAFSGIPQKEMTGLVLPFSDVDSPLCRLIEQYMESTPDVAAFTALVDRLFMAHLKTDFYQQGFEQASKLIINSGGLVSIKELSDEVFYSERHLSRLFDEYVGVSTKAFSRLVRVNKALFLLRRPSLSLTQICMQTGFYDMPHFIRDFKSICGVTPQELRANMSDFYSAVAKF